MTHKGWRVVKPQHNQMAPFDVPPTGDQEVAGSIPAGSEIDHEIFSMVPSAVSRKAVVSFWRKNVHNTG